MKCNLPQKYRKNKRLSKEENKILQSIADTVVSNTIFNKDKINKGVIDNA